jgi:hypothetical protein
MTKKLTNNEDLIDTCVARRISAPVDLSHRRRNAIIRRFAFCHFRCH